MRHAKVPEEVVYQKVWESLRKRQDPDTHLVRPSWLEMMRSIGVCRQRIAQEINCLKAEGKLEVVLKPRADAKRSDYFYKVVER